MAINNPRKGRRERASDHPERSEAPASEPVAEEGHQPDPAPAPDQIQPATQEEAQGGHGAPQPANDKANRPAAGAEEAVIERPRWEERLRGIGKAPIRGPARPPGRQSLITLADDADDDTPWEHTRRTTTHTASLGLSEAAWAQLRWLGDHAPQSQNMILRNLIEPGIDALARRTWVKERTEEGEVAPEASMEPGVPAQIGQWEAVIRDTARWAAKGPARPPKAGLVTENPELKPAGPWVGGTRTRQAQASLNMAETTWEQVRWLADRLPQSQNMLLRNLVEPVVDEMAATIRLQEAME